MAKQTQAPKKPEPQPLEDVKFDRSQLNPIGDTYGAFERAMDELTKTTSQGAIALVLGMIAIGKTLLQGLSSSIDCMSADYNGEHAKWFTEYNRSRGYSVEQGSIDNIKSRVRSVTIAFHLVPGVINTLQTLTPLGQGMSNFFYLSGVMSSKKSRNSRKYENLRPLWEKMLTIPLGMETAGYQKTLDTLYGKTKEKRQRTKKKPVVQPNYGDESSATTVHTPEKGVMVAASTIEPGNPEINGSNPETLAKANALMLSLNFADRCKVIGHVMTPAELVKLVLACVDKVDNNALEDIKRKVLGLTAKHPVSIPSQVAQASPAPSVPAVN